MFTRGCRPFPVKKVQLEDDTDRVKPHINSTPTTSSYSRQAFSAWPVNTVDRRDPNKKRGWSLSDSPHTLIALNSRQIRQSSTKCVIRKSTASSSALFSFYSLVFMSKATLATVQRPVT